MYWLSFVLGSYVVVCLFSNTRTAIVRFQQNYQNVLHDEADDYYLSCYCKEGIKNTTLEMGMAESLIRGDDMAEQCHENLQRLKACESLRFCKKCSILVKKCSPPGERNESFCVFERFFLEESPDFELQISEMESNRSSTSLIGRSKRNTRTCGYPTNMKTADVACYSSLRRVKCTQSCIFGHTLPDGQERKMTCKREENQWKPKGFRECEPFVDCTLNLISPGALDCYTGTRKTPPACKIRCDHYEDKDAIPKRSYGCELDGTWSKPLPFCVKQGSGLHLVPKPENIIHFDD